MHLKIKVEYACAKEIVQLRFKLGLIVKLFILEGVWMIEKFDNVFKKISNTNKNNSNVKIIGYLKVC